MNQNDKDNKNEVVDFSEKVTQTVDKFVNTPDRTNNYDVKEIENNKMYAVLCYISLLFVVPIYKKLHKKSSYIMFHVNQGVNLFLTYIIAFIITGILKSLFVEVYYFSSHTPGWVSFIIFMIYSFMAVLNIIGVVNAYNGKAKELPLIGKYRFIK